MAAAELQVPTRCVDGFGIHLRNDPCKICYGEISETDRSLTHVEDPCYTTFHFDCLQEWLPHAAHVPDPITNTGKKEPSCPNCRGSLGETNLAPPDDMDVDSEHLDAWPDHFVLAPHAHPVQSLDELRDIVGDEAFTQIPLVERRLPRPIPYYEIPVEQPAPVVLPQLTTAAIQQADPMADFPWLVESTNAIPTTTGNPQEDFRNLFPYDLVMAGAPQHPNSSLRTTQTPTPDQATVHTLLNRNLFSLGITHYEAYYFPLPSLINTTFYIPMRATIRPVPSLARFREEMQSNRAFHDPTMTGRFLRPAVHTTEQIQEALHIQNDEAGLEVISNVILNLPYDLELEGWAVYMPSSIDRFGLLYAIPYVSASNESDSGESASGQELGEIIHGLLVDEDMVDTTQYWPPTLSATQRRHFYGDVDEWRQHEIEIAQYDRVFEEWVLGIQSAHDEPVVFPPSHEPRAVNVDDEDDEARWLRELQAFNAQQVQRLVPRQPEEVTLSDDETEASLSR